MFSMRSSMIFYNELQQHNWIRKMMQKDLMINDDKWSEIVMTMKKKMISLKIYDIKLDSELTKKKLRTMITKIIIIFDKEIESISQNWLKAYHRIDCTRHWWSWLSDWTTTKDEEHNIENEYMKTFSVKESCKKRLKMTMLINYH